MKVLQIFSTVFFGIAGFAVLPIELELIIKLPISIVCIFVFMMFLLDILYKSLGKGEW